jgi:hypothetical protein
MGLACLTPIQVYLIWALVIVSVFRTKKGCDHMSLYKASGYQFRDHIRLQIYKRYFNRVRSDGTWVFDYKRKNRALKHQVFVKQRQPWVQAYLRQFRDL